MAPSVGTLVQFLVLGVLGYILAGAPLLSILSGSPKRESFTQPISLDKAETLVIPDDGLVCPEHAYKIHLLSRDPLVIYIEGFLSAEEASHVVQMRYV